MWSTGILGWGLALIASSHIPGFVAAGDKQGLFSYSVDPGFFIQEDPSINTNPPDYTKVEYGLIDRPYPTDPTFDPTHSKPKWERFGHFVHNLNHNNTTAIYKVLYLARHGEAYHNLAQTHYPPSCWSCYWSRLDGNGTTTWRDAELTPHGTRQVLASHAFWRDTAPALGIPFPSSFYVGPMARTLATANLTFAALPVWNASNPFAPTVKESLRETINVCTCAWRHPRAWIHARFPSYRFEAGFTEEDELFTGDSIESASAQVARAARFLDDVFAADDGVFVSVSTHGVLINPLLGAIGHPNPGLSLTTGQAVAVLVRGERVSGGVARVGEPPVGVERCDEGCGGGV